MNMNEKEINKSLEQQLELLSKASKGAVSQLDYQSLKPITEAMIEIKHEIVKAPFK